MNKTVFLFLLYMPLLSHAQQWVTTGVNIYNTNTGYVGVGTSAPAARLHIADGGLRHGGTGEISIDAIGIIGGRFKILDNGKVGIGTPSPEQKLDVRGNLVLESGGNAHLFTGTGASELNRYLQLLNSSNYQSASGLKAGGILVSDSYSYANPGKNDLIVKGNVGIGTPTPAEKLEVNGNLSVGLNAGAATGYGNRLNLRGVDDSASGDPIWLARYNTAANQTELRVNIGDDVGQAQDMFVVGTHHWNGGTWYPHLAVQASGNVGIGTADTKGYKLAVAGKAIAEEVTVKLQSSWPDYVFEPTYDLKQLAEIETYIKENKHLPEVPSAKEMEANGVQLGEMNMLLLKKIEELTLYVIELKKRDEAQQKEIEELRKSKD